MARTSFLSPTHLWIEEGERKTYRSLEQILPRPALCREGLSVTAGGGGEGDRIAGRENRRSWAGLVVWLSIGAGWSLHALRGLLWPRLSLLQAFLYGCHQWLEVGH